MNRLATMATPAFPAATLLFGMTYAFAVVHLLGLRWNEGVTFTIFLVPLAWVAWLVWRDRSRLDNPNLLDMLFGGFVLLVSVSLLTSRGVPVTVTHQFLGFLLFMTIVPYFCGRLMRLRDIRSFLRICLVAGLVLMPLLLIDRLTSYGRVEGRWAFFGQDHGALLVGGVLTASLLALCAYALSERLTGKIRQSVLYGLIGLVTVGLVWVTARGWLFAALVGVAVAVWAVRQNSAMARLKLIAVVACAMAIAIATLPRFDPLFANFYSAHPSSHDVPTAVVHAGAHPILGKESCRPIEAAVDSVAIRLVLYQEALAVFTARPLFGSGANNFGKHSCSGHGGFPHSTLLQGLAELGLFGGGLFLALIAMGFLTLAGWRLQAGKAGPVVPFSLALCASYLVADQIYGNYFMSTGTYLLLGITAGLRADGGFKTLHA